MARPTAIAIDGPVASGKTVVGQLVAGRLGHRFLDTGVMYRAVTWVALDRGVDLAKEKDLGELAMGVEMRLDGERLLVDGRDVTEHLRAPEVEQAVSLVASVPKVREALVAQQRAIAREDPIVMVGRDIGTVVLPDAPIKVYLNASVGVRAQRRHRELQRDGVTVDYGQVEGELIRRDTIDSERADSPLRPAEDAVQIDTDDLEVQDVAQKVVDLAEGS